MTGFLSAQASEASDSRYGPLGVFDHRSLYGKGVFPEPFLVDDSDLEANEFRLDWLHQEAAGRQLNRMRPELEKGLSLMTLELAVPYEYNTFRSSDAQAQRSAAGRREGFDNVDVAARNPFLQYVSDDEAVDTTLGVGVEVGIPTNSPLSRSAEIVPKLFNDTILGEHLTLQTLVGYSFVLGPPPDGGSQRLEYGMTLGWAFQHTELPVPEVEQIIPVFEFSGTTLANTHAGGSNMLIGNAAIRVNLRSTGTFQPRLGVGYVFPLDEGGRRTLRWGVFTSLVFQF